jgi:hypothetical protein
VSEAGFFEIGFLILARYIHIINSIALRNSKLTGIFPDFWLIAKGYFSQFK